MDHRADFYSLGAILFHLLAGGPLFGYGMDENTILRGEEVSEIANSQLAEVPPPPTKGDNLLLDELVLHLLEKNPDQRYQSGRQLFHSLLILQQKG